MDVCPTYRMCSPDHEGASHKANQDLNPRSNLNAVYMVVIRTVFIVSIILLAITLLEYYTNIQTALPHLTKLQVERADIHAPLQELNDKPFLFIESSCVSNRTRLPQGGLRLNGRQACAIYSTAKLHPKREVYLYHSCPLSQDYYSQSSEGAKILKDLNNLKIINTNVSDWVSGTPVESKMKDLMTSSHPVEHSSDLLRLALLWKIGATYLDLDVITITSLEKLGRNWVSAESTNELANGVMDFDKGHRIPFLVMEQLKTSYDPQGWATNGPLLLESVIKKNCPSVMETVWDQVGYLGDCRVKVLPSHLMFPYHYSAWRVFFQQPKTETDKAQIYLKIGRSHTVHLYNYLSSKTKSEGPNSPYRVMASIFCQPVHNKDPDDF